jgi:hypothetical protein
MRARSPPFDDGVDESGGRGQTTIDFAVGMSVFLLTVAFTFAFVPGLLDPFDGRAPGGTAAAERVADDTAMGLLGDPSAPRVLDVSCTVAFFEGTTPGECGLGSGTLADQVGLDDRYRLNVSIERNDASGERRCWNRGEDGGPAGLVSPSASTCDVRLSRGDAVSTSEGSVATARRVVSFADRDVTLVVRVW